MQLMNKLGIFVDGVRVVMDLENIKKKIKNGEYDGISVVQYTEKMMTNLMAERFLERIKSR